MVDKPAFKMGDHGEKISGSSWRGRVVGTYSTDLTPEGYAVESDTEKGSVQIYPEKALRLATPANGEQVERAREAINALDWDSVYKAARKRTLNDATGTFYDEHLALEVADRIAATLSAPTEDARSRVKVLEEALRGLVDLYDTDEGCRSLPQIVAARTALGNKETDRHG